MISSSKYPNATIITPFVTGVIDGGFGIPVPLPPDDATAGVVTSNVVVVFTPLNTIAI